MAWRRFSLKKLRLARSAVYGFDERVLGTSRVTSLTPATAKSGMSG